MVLIIKKKNEKKRGQKEREREKERNKLAQKMQCIASANIAHHWLSSAMIKMRRKAVERWLTKVYAFQNGIVRHTQ
jgi:deferrochelatase/peroxidase EfeB